MKVLSISIAAYNVEAFLNNCLESFIDDGNPLMDKLEVIIVSDGSKDNTVSIAKEYERKYPDTFVLVDKVNGGYGSTINTSIKIASGKYYKLVDGDDWVNTEDLYKLIAFLEKTDADMVLSRYCFVNDVDGSKKMPTRQLEFDGVQHSFEEMGSEDAFEMHYLTFKTSILRDNQISITEKCFYTDVEYMLKPIPFVNTYAAVDLCVYMYRIGREGQSVSISSWQKNIDMALKVTYVLVNFYNQVKDEISENKRKYIFGRIEGTAEGKYRIFLSFMPNTTIKNRIKEYDLNLKNMNMEIYSACMKNRFVKLLRISRFAIYYPLAIAYRKHLKRTKQI